MQNRKGNTPESYDQKNIIETAINNCRQKGILINAFRADACCYEKDTIEYLESENITYYIRAENCLRLIDTLADEPDWQPATIGYRKMEVCSMHEVVLGKYRRIVAHRYKQEKGQLDIFNKDAYRYYAVVTFNYEHTPIECIETYNYAGSLPALQYRKKSICPNAPFCKTSNALKKLYSAFCKITGKVDKNRQAMDTQNLH